MTETSPKKPMDHTGMFWIHGSNVLEITQRKDLETMRRMIKYGWRSIPSKWKKKEDEKRMKELEDIYDNQEYGDGHDYKNEDDVLSDMWQFVVDVALENKMIPEKRSFFV